MFYIQIQIGGGLVMIGRILNFLSQKRVSKYELGRAFETLLFITGLHHNYMREFDRQYSDLMDFESFLLRTPIEHWVMAVKCPIKDFGWWQELDIRWQIYHKGIIK